MFPVYVTDKKSSCSWSLEPINSPYQGCAPVPVDAECSLRAVGFPNQVYPKQCRAYRQRGARNVHREMSKSPGASARRQREHQSELIWCGSERHTGKLCNHSRSQTRRRQRKMLKRPNKGRGHGDNPRIFVTSSLCHCDKANGVVQPKPSGVRKEAMVSTKINHNTWDQKRLSKNE